MHLTGKQLWAIGEFADGTNAYLYQPRIEYPAGKKGIYPVDQYRRVFVERTDDRVCVVVDTNGEVTDAPRPWPKTEKV